MLDHLSAIEIKGGEKSKFYIELFLRYEKLVQNRFLKMFWKAVI